MTAIDESMTPVQAGPAAEPFVAARYYSFQLPVFRDVVEGSGAVISIGVSRRFR